MVSFALILALLAPQLTWAESCSQRTYVPHPLQEENPLMDLVAIAGILTAGAVTYKLTGSKMKALGVGAAPGAVIWGSRAIAMNRLENGLDGRELLLEAQGGSGDRLDGVFNRLSQEHPEATKDVVAALIRAGDETGLVCSKGRLPFVHEIEDYVSQELSKVVNTPPVAAVDARSKELLESVRRINATTLYSDQGK